MNVPRNNFLFKLTRAIVDGSKSYSYQQQRHMAQRSITNFFKKSTAKRNAEDEGVDLKRQKTNEVQSDVNIGCDLLESLDPTLSNVGTTWFNALKQEFTKDYFRNLSSFLEVERKSQTIYPPSHQVYTWTQMCRINDVKVVILGQDPYHGPRQAHGLCFSVQKGVVPPPSLKNMYKELQSDIPGFEAPKHGDLTGWAKQGVLLLNACLTVRANNANSHAGKGWEELTDAVIKYLDQSCNNVVFLLWGAYAEKKGSVIKNKSHLVLRTTHPSPLSAHRGFLGSKMSATIYQSCTHPHCTFRISRGNCIMAKGETTQVKAREMRTDSDNLIMQPITLMSLRNGCKKIGS